MKDDAIQRQFRTERAKRAADARWAKARIEARLWKIAEGYMAADPKLTRAQAFTNAVKAHPDIYEEYNRAAAQMPHLTFSEMEDAYQSEVRALCTLADYPDMADEFIRDRVEQRDVIAQLLERKKAGK